jgi:hypothetical protein
MASVHRSQQKRAEPGPVWRRVVANTDDAEDARVG